MPNLILSRHVGERIMIGDSVVLTLVAIRGEKVRFAIEAPIEIRVDREEVREARRRDKGGAA